MVLRGQGDLGEEGGCQFELVGRGGTPPESCGYRSGGVGSQPTNPGSSPSPSPSTPAVSFLFILWWEVEAHWK